MSLLCQPRQSIGGAHPVPTPFAGGDLEAPGVLEAALAARAPAKELVFLSVGLRPHCDSWHHERPGRTSAAAPTDACRARLLAGSPAVAPSTRRLSHLRPLWRLLTASALWQPLSAAPVHRRHARPPAAVQGPGAAHHLHRLPAHPASQPAPARHRTLHAPHDRTALPQATKGALRPRLRVDVALGEPPRAPRLGTQAGRHVPHVGTAVALRRSLACTWV